jgi:hypothetical protein
MLISRRAIVLWGVPCAIAARCGVAAQSAGMPMPAVWKKRRLDVTDF